MRSFYHRFTEAFFVLLAAMILASPWPVNFNGKGERTVASLSQPVPMNYMLATPLGNMAYKNAAWDVLSPMDSRLLGAVLDELRPYAYNPQVADSWDGILNMDAGSFGKQLDNMMNFAGYQVQRNRQIWGNQYAHVFGRNLFTNASTGHTIGGNAPSLFVGGVSADGAVPWGGTDANLLDRPAPKSVASSIFPEFNGQRREIDVAATRGRSGLQTQVGSTIIGDSSSAYDPRAGQPSRNVLTTGKAAQNAQGSGGAPTVGFSAK